MEVREEVRRDLCWQPSWVFIGCEFFWEIFVAVNRYVIAWFLSFWISVELYHSRFAFRGVLGREMGNSMGLILDAKSSTLFFWVRLDECALMPVCCVEAAGLVLCLDAWSRSGDDESNRVKH